MNITYRFENQRNPEKEREFARACIELARKHPQEEVKQALAEKKRRERQEANNIKEA